MQSNLFADHGVAGMDFEAREVQPLEEVVPVDELEAHACWGLGEARRIAISLTARSAYRIPRNHAQAGMRLCVVGNDINTEGHGPGIGRAQVVRSESYLTASTHFQHFSSLSQLAVS